MDDFDDNSEYNDDRAIGLFAVGGGMTPTKRQTRTFTDKDKTKSKIKSFMGKKRNGQVFKEFLHHFGKNFDEVYDLIKSLPDQEAINLVHEIINQNPRDEPEEIDSDDGANSASDEEDVQQNQNMKELYENNTLKKVFDSLKANRLNGKMEREQLGLESH